MHLTDPFSKIPAPLLLSIVKLLPNLVCLYSLDKASPSVASLFDECGAEIIEAIMSSNSAEQIQILIRTIEIIRSHSLQSASLEEFINTYISQEIPCEIWSEHSDCIKRDCFNVNRRSERPSEACRVCGIRKPLSKMAASTPSRVLRQILDLTLQMNCFTDICLQTMIGRCIQLEPSHLLNSEFRYVRRLYDKTCSQRRPSGQRYQPQNAGPSSFAEQERVIRAFWRVILFYDLRAAVTNSKLIWPSEDATYLQSPNIGPEDFWGERFGKCQQEQLRAVVEFLQEMIQTHSPGTSVPEFFASIPQLFTQENACVYRLVSQPSQQPQYSHFIDDETVGYFLSYGIDHRSRANPTKYIDFSVLRRLGFCIWDEKRLAYLGFVNCR
ncbi:hypothetical protein F5884DRAFT_802034 [Xylogone sp. PMI_703]|nr:hypothetical protein F5884DRAFT_802034 [Xylogone sp. PMI_703]